MESRELRDSLISAQTMKRLRQHAEVVSDTVLTEFGSATAVEALAQIHALITGWGCPPIDRRILRLAPELKLIAHSAGTVKTFVDEECWRSGVVVTNAAQANSLPVAEYTLAFIVLAGKKAFAQADALRSRRSSAELPSWSGRLGNNGNTIGVIGASRVGRLVRPLRDFTFMCWCTTPLSPSLMPENSAQNG